MLDEVDVRCSLTHRHDAIVVKIVISQIGESSGIALLTSVFTMGYTGVAVQISANLSGFVVLFRARSNFHDRCISRGGSGVEV